MTKLNVMEIATICDALVCQNTYIEKLHGKVYTAESLEKKMRDIWNKMVIEKNLTNCHAEIKIVKNK